MNSERNRSNKLMDFVLTHVPRVSAKNTASQAVSLIKKNKKWDAINYIYVLDDSNRLAGVVSIKELLRSKAAAPLSRIMVADPVSIPATAPKEKAAALAIKHNIKAVPVVHPKTKEFIGIFGTDQLLNFLHYEHVENFLKFSGIIREHPTIDIFKAKPVHLIKLRMPWLLVGLVGGMISAALASVFQPILEKELTMVFFIPVVVYISNAISIQSQAILLRSLSSQKVNAYAFIKREYIVTSVLALAAAAAISAYAGVWLNSCTIALTLCLAIIISTLVSVSIAIIIPLILYSFKKDPALGSGPFTTAIQDVTTLLVYFLIASLLII